MDIVYWVILTLLYFGWIFALIGGVLALSDNDSPKSEWQIFWGVVALSFILIPVWPGVLIAGLPIFLVWGLIQGVKGLRSLKKDA